MVLLVACGGSGGGGEPAVSSSALTESISEVPIVGQFLSDCTEPGVALIQGFVGDELPLDPPAGVPGIADILELGDPDAIPLIGGLVPPGLLSGDLVPVSIDDALGMLPAGGLPADLPVAGAAPITCSDLPLPTADLPDPTDALGLVPVFDEAGDPVAVIVAVTGAAQGNAPAITDVTLPDSDGALPDELGTVVTTLMGLLSL